MALIDLIEAYKAQVNADITAQSTANSIPPDVVGSMGVDLANLLIQALAANTDLNILSGDAIPSEFIGADKDLYFRSGPVLEIYRKFSATWVVIARVANASLTDSVLYKGVISVTATDISLTATQWVIGGVTKTLTTATHAIAAADAGGLLRIDIVVGNLAGTTQYVTGVAAENAIQPDVPVDTVLIQPVFVSLAGITLPPVLENGYVQKIGNENIGGIKTFIQSPIVPDATLAQQVVPLAQVQSLVAGAAGSLKAVTLTFANFEADKVTVNYVGMNTIKALSVRNLGGLSEFLSEYTTLPTGGFTINQTGLGVGFEAATDTVVQVWYTEEAQIYDTYTEPNYYTPSGYSI